METTKNIMFSTIYGHHKVLSYLEHLIATDDLPPALLFHGESGVGKRTLAFAVAKMLNCKGQRNTTCTCSSCQKIGAGHHLDVFSYRPEGNTFKIDQVRDLITHTERGRMEGRYRVFILEESDRLNAQAADALLKTLEEGRPNTLFILLASSKRQIVPTLVSRTLDFYFGVLTKEQVGQVLREQDLMAGTRARVAVSLSGGSVEKALYYLEGSGFDVRDRALLFLSEYPGIRDFRILREVNDLGEQLNEFLQILYDLLSDICILQADQDRFIRNVDVEDTISSLKDRFGARSFDAFSRVRSVLDMADLSVAYDHQVKSTLLNLKDDLR